MTTTRLRKVGGSIMMSLPPAILNELQLKPGASVGLAVESGRLVVMPQRQPRYTLDELLAGFEPAAESSSADQQWLESAPEGRELL